MICSECNRPVRARGLCITHYMQWWRKSNPERNRLINSRSQSRIRWETFVTEATMAGKIRLVSTEQELVEALTFPEPFLMRREST